MLTKVFHCVSDKSEKCVSIVSGGTFGGGDVSISYTEILPSRECARATGERLPNRKPISISTISSTAPPLPPLKFQRNYFHLDWLSEGQVSPK